MFPMKYWTETLIKEAILRERAEDRLRFVKKI